MGSRDSSYDADRHRGSYGTDLLPTAMRNSNAGKRRGSYKPSSADGSQFGCLETEVCYSRLRILVFFPNLLCHFVIVSLSE